MSSKYGKIPRGRVSQMQSYLRQRKWFQLFLEEAHRCLVFFLTLDHQHQQLGLGPGSVLLRTLSKDGKYFNRIVLSSRFQRVAKGIFCSDCCIHPGREYIFWGYSGYSVVTQSPKEYGWSQLCFASQHQREYFRCKPCEIHLGRSWSPDKTKQNSILGKHSSNERRKKIGNVKVDGALLTKALLQSRMMDFPYMLEWQRRQELLERCLVIVVHCLWHLLKSCPVFFDRLRREQVRENYSACSKK